MNAKKHYLIGKIYDALCLFYALNRFLTREN